MRTSPLVPVALALALLLPAVALGGDGQPAAPVAPADPAAAFDAYTATLPAPSVEQGIRFAGTLHMNGRQVGTCSFTAAPYEAASGTAQWEVRDRVEFPSASGRRVEESVAFLTPALSLLRGSTISTRDGGQRRDWVRTDKGFCVTTTTRAGDVLTEAVRNVEHAGSATTTMTSAFLFGRLALAGAGEFATSIFDSGKVAEGKPPMVPVIYSVAGRGPWQGGQALLVRGKKGDTDLLAAYHVRTRIFLGARMREGEGRVIEFLPGTKWTLPARNAKTCALRAALGFASGDASLLDQVVHWPSIFDQAMGRRPEGSAAIDPEEFRSRVLKGWDEKLPRNERALIEDVLNGFEAQLQVEETGTGRARVTFPEAFKGLVLDVADVDGTWYLAALPGMD